MKSGFIVLLLLAGLSAAADPGDLVKITHLTDTPVQVITLARRQFCPDEASVSTTYGFKRYKVDFRTMDVQGNDVVSSGLLILPDGAKGLLPVFIYQHGTVTARAELPSSNPKNAEGDAIGYCYASLGYVSVLADYLGYGDGTGPHPYLHADSEAWVARDMLRASMTAIHRMKIKRNGKFFIGGYSQGGHAAMSLFRFLSRIPTTNFQSPRPPQWPALMLCRR